jgi:hypothetical protein
MAGQDRRNDSNREEQPSADDSAHHGAKPPSVSVVLRRAREQLEELLGRAPESVSGLSRTEDGWEVEVDVLDLARVPDSTSVIATYGVQLDRDGELIGYQKKRRYARGQIDLG